MSEFAPVPIPAAVRSLFEIEFSPASLIRYDRDAWELDEVRKAMSTLSRLESDATPEFRWRRSWAEREFDAAVAAFRKRLERGRKPGMEMNIEMLDVFEQLESVTKNLAPSAELVMALPMNEMRYRYAGLAVVQPDRPISVLFLGDVSTLAKDDEFKFPMEKGIRFAVSVESLYRIVSVVFGFSLSNTRQRISRARDHLKRRRVRYRERRRRGHP